MVQFCYLRLYLGIETDSYRLLKRMARMDMDWNMKKLGQLFQVLMPCLQKKTPKKLLCLILPDEMCLISNHVSNGAFFVWVKALSI